MSFLKDALDDDRTDAELVERYKRSGDLKVLAALYQRYMDLVHGVCLKYLEDAEAARDAVMQVFEELVVKLKNHEVDRFKSWLYAVAKNHCLMQLRSQKRHRTVSIDPELVQSADIWHPEGRSNAEEPWVHLNDCLEGLPEEQRESIRLFYLEQKSYHEITAMTGLDWNLVRSRIQNGRRNLRNCMERKQEED